MMCFWNDWNGMFGMSWKSLHVFTPSSIAFSFAVRKLLHNHQQLIDHEYGSPAWPPTRYTSWQPGSWLSVWEWFQASPTHHLGTRWTTTHHSITTPWQHGWEGHKWLQLRDGLLDSCPWPYGAPRPMTAPGQPGQPGPPGPPGPPPLAQQCSVLRPAPALWVVLLPVPSAVSAHRHCSSPLADLEAPADLHSWRQWHRHQPCLEAAALWGGYAAMLCRSETQLGYGQTAPAWNHDEHGELHGPLMHDGISWPQKVCFK